MGANDRLRRAESRERLLWILYTDLNSRFNTLVEECAHLQDTISGLVTKSDVVRGIIEKTSSAEKPAGFARATLSDIKIDSIYYTLSVRDRALLSLWNTLGALIRGLDANQLRHRAEYEKMALDLARVDENKGQSVYLYIGLRGYFLNTLFLEYTAQLEHAHEKIVQMLENQAGTLPNPILLRRWNSGLYGEFLSEYSRHVNWEARACVDSILPESKHISGVAITHTWTHHPTSTAKFFDIGFKDSVGNEKTSRFAIIRSAYFYLEQPVLFPLLYHECVHINFPENDDVKRDHRELFGARLAAIESLRLAKFPGSSSTSYENFWDHFTEEVWADALSITLGGRAYLIALSLQLFGLSGAEEYNHYRIDADTIYPLETLGSARHRKYEVNYPELEMGFFWEARLAVAANFLTHLIEGKNPAEIGVDEKISLDMAASIIGVIRQWHLSGIEANNSDVTSPAHSDYWRYRREINEWVEKTIVDHLSGAISRLPFGGTAICSAYEITSSSARAWISNAVNNYRHRLIPESNTAEGFKLSSRHRLENVSLDVRWAVAGDVIRAIRKNPASLSQWTAGFASWMRNDGGVAFRMALEFSRIRLALLDALADYLDGSEKNNADAGDLWGEVAKLPADWLKGDHENIVKFLRRRGITNSSHLDHQDDRLVALRDAWEELADRIMATLDKSFDVGDSLQPSECKEIQVGTLMFGVVRPAEFETPPSEFCAGGYVGGLDMVSRHLSEAARNQTLEAEARQLRDEAYLQSKPNFETSFLRLIGEYQFLAYTAGSTPVERDYHPQPHVPRMLVKPRLVLQVGGRPLSQAIALNTGMYGRVSLIRFKYRWQWHDLLSKLAAYVTTPERVIHDYSLLLSSAWEDVILVTWHKKAPDLWKLGLVGLKVDGKSPADMQSTFFVPVDSYEADVLDKMGPTCESWIDQMRDWRESSGLVSKVYRRSGRYDYTVVWQDKCGECESTLAASAKGLATMPAEMWSKVSHMITSFEEVEVGGLSDSDKYASVTHFAVKGSLAVD